MALASIQVATCDRVIALASIQVATCFARARMRIFGWPPADRDREHAVFEVATCPNVRKDVVRAGGHLQMRDRDREFAGGHLLCTNAIASLQVATCFARTRSCTSGGGRP
jgi:hypothetical protein